MRFLLTLNLLWLGMAHADPLHMLIQSSPLAGSQYYAVDERWREMKVGDRLALIREPGNRHDPNAIRVEWRGHKLGYVPRAENRPVAAAMDQGDRLLARILRLRDEADPWRRVEFEVFAEL